MIDKKLVAFLAVLISIVLLGGAAAVMGGHGDKESAALVVGIATGLVGVLKMPSWSELP